MPRGRMRVMNIELARELKDAGFPQKSDYGYRGVSIISYHRGIHLETDVCIPTLEELMEACGDDFYSVVRIGGGDYKAFSTDDDENTVAVTGGSTPIEAVAHLWLALNKKA